MAFGFNSNQVNLPHYQANHITCAIDGVCYDTFDPSDRLIWCVYFVKD